jgi:hypothetical protein
MSENKITEIPPAAMIHLMDCVPKFSLKDDVISDKGRIGKVVTAMERKGEETEYGILWNDNQNFVDHRSGNGLSTYKMPGAIEVEGDYYRLFGFLALKSTC